jgi:hypothetical protein
MKEKRNKKQVFFMLGVVGQSSTFPGLRLTSGKLENLLA